MVRTRIHLGLLAVFSRLPRRARRQIVRIVAPTFSAGAMCFIERDDGRILLVRHPYRKHWGVPGGLLDRGEDAADGGRREVLEEVGLVIDLVGEPSVQVDAEARRIDVVFRARPVADADPDQARPISPEIAETAWRSLDDLPPLQFETRGALALLARVQSGGSADEAGLVDLSALASVAPRPGSRW